MNVRRFRIKEATIAMFEDNGRGVARKVSPGEVIELHLGSLESDRLADVVWNGKMVMMFTQDLRSRAELIE